MFKKIFRKLRNMAGDAAPVIGALTGNPLLGAGIGAFAKDDPLKSALYGGLGGFGGRAFGMGSGGGGGSNFMDMLGNFGKAATGSAGYTTPAVEARGLLGGAQSLGGGIMDLLKMGETAAGSNLGKAALPTILSLITKNALEDDIDPPVDMNAYRSSTDEKYGGQFGGRTNRIEDNIRGTAIDPSTGVAYDFYDAVNNTYKNFETDGEGNIINRASGGIAKLNMGGNPFDKMTRIKGTLGGGIQPRNFNDGGMTAGDMMDKMEDNPGIAQYFPRKFGDIKGPGGPKDDKIPAMLSNGEFVFTAKAVDKLGGPNALYKVMNKVDPESSKGIGRG